jgi:hypothetical protein
MGTARLFKSRGRLTGAACLALSLLALLLWGKLKLVTGVPRTAYADPNGKPAAWRHAAGHPAQERQR